MNCDDHSASALPYCTSPVPHSRPHWVQRRINHSAYGAYAPGPSILRGPTTLKQGHYWLIVLRTVNLLLYAVKMYTGCRIHGYHKHYLAVENCSRCLISCVWLCELILNYSEGLCLHQEVLRSVVFVCWLVRSFVRSHVRSLTSCHQLQCLEGGMKAALHCALLAEVAPYERFFILSFSVHSNERINANYTSNADRPYCTLLVHWRSLVSDVRKHCSVMQFIDHPVSTGFWCGVESLGVCRNWLHTHFELLRGCTECSSASTSCSPYCLIIILIGLWR